MALLPCCLLVLLRIAQGEGPSGPGRRRGGGSTNVHVTFGDPDSCVAPPSGTCADFTITEAQVIASLAGFTTYKGGSLTITSINYYGDWWINNVSTDTSVAVNFCTNGDGAGQTSTLQNYSGVSYSAGSGQWTMETASTPAADCEDYCSAAGGMTPAFMGTTFGSSYTQTFSLTPSSKRRGDISNTVGYAVDGVVIFSPFTGISTVAPYDETLDTCNGHPANGLYHYHGFSPCIHGESGAQTGASISHSKIYGWAFDGFPIYGPYGYTDGNDTSSAVVRVTGGYGCTSNDGACTTDAQKAVPTNWAYSTSIGMLDDCNGRWTKTPEFPDGMYVYVLNVQANGSPDFPGVPYCVQSTSLVLQTPGPTMAPTTTATPTTTVAPTVEPPTTTGASTTVPTTTATTGTEALTTAGPTTAAPITATPSTCGAAVGSKWNDQKCSQKCTDMSKCSLTTLLGWRCNQRCNENCACNSRRLAASILV